MNSTRKSNVVIPQTRKSAPGQRPLPGRLKMHQASEPHSSRPAANSCDHSNNSRQSKQTVIPSHLFKFLVITSVVAIAPVAAAPASSSNEFQLVARAGGQARLPCLIGKQALCGEPYFIAWYKLNATSRQWSRVEARRLTASEDSTAPTPSDRIQFVMPRTDGAASSSSSCPPQVDNRTTMGGSDQQQQQLTYSNRQVLLAGGLAAGQKSLAARSFDCGQLTIGGLDLIDEGQYKCEITFSDSLDFDSCPASTMTQLNVIARPNEPEISLNGKPLAGQMIAQTGGSGASGLTFKEGAQVRLECQSAGGKPAPRIEWLNVTSVGRPANSADFNDDDQSMVDTRRPPDPVQVQIMRSYWPIKRASYSIPASVEPSSNNINQAASQPRGGAQIPVTSSTVTITLSRFDMRSRFACLVVPAHQWGDQPQSQQQQQPISTGKSYAQVTDETTRDKNWAGMPEVARDQARLAEWLDRTPMLEAPGQRDGEPAPLLKWIKLDILAKPTSVSMRVLDLATRALVRPEQPDSLPHAGRHEQQPVYSLHPNRAYAIQCLVEHSRPRSQVAWFNRTAPVELEQLELRSSGPDYLVAPQRGSNHRLTSFVHYAPQESGAFRTTASLVLTTNFQDNFDEFFCRVSNGAFQFDELAQVAPIISARLHVNYPPTAWLETPEVKWTEQATGRLGGELGQRVQMRCLVGANPLTLDTILAIDWLKDGRRLAAAPSAAGGNSSQPGRLTIEKTNHLHTPLVGQSPQLDLANRISASSVDQQQLAAQASRLMAASSLTITSLSKSDAGRYSCQFRLIPMQQQQQQQHQVADSGGSLLTAGPNLSPFQQQQMKTITGQANQSIQLNVIEAKLPLAQVASTSGLLVYDKLTLTAGPRAPGAKLDRQNLEVVVTGRRARITLRCDLDSAGGARARQFELGHKVLWQLNGAFLHSSTSEQLEIDLAPAAQTKTSDENGELAARLLVGNGGRLTCAHHLLEPSSLQAPNFHSQAMRVLGSSNELDLRFKVEAKLLQTTRQELLMPPLRSFSELELVAQPLNRLRLVCLAQCEPLCSIEWLANRRPVHELHSALSSGNGELQDAGRPVQVREMADNQTQIFKSTRRLAGTLVELENLIHRRTLTSAEHFPWYRQTSLVSGQLQSEPATSPLELANRQLMRDSYELIQSSGPEALASNVFSKLELSYNQLSQMLSLASLAHQDELQLECQLTEFLDGRDRHQGAQPEAGVQFGQARVRAGVFHPSRAGETREELDGSEQPPGMNGAQLGVESLNSSALFQEDQREQHGPPRIHRFQTRVILEKSLKSDNSAPSAFASGNFPILLSPQLASNSSHSQNRPFDSPQTPQGPTTSPVVRNWLANHLDLVLIVACSVALVWLLSLFVSPLMRRHFFARSPSSTVNMLKQKRVLANNHQHWPRFNPPGSRASSTNEIGLFGGSSHKFAGGISAPNYYGAPDSAGGDSSEHDMVQSCSQSSHYEDFIQHQLAQQQRLGVHHHHQQQQQQVVQPLYFNQAHLVESTTLSRRPLMKSSYSSSSTGGDTSGSSGGDGSRAPLAASRIYGDIRQQHPHPAASFASTMRHATQPQVQPLISNATCTSSRINFSDLQRHRPEQHAGPQTFGKQQQAPVPLGQHLARMQEHIYDDVS